MSNLPKVMKLLAPTILLTLEVEDVPQKLELKLAWTMRGVIVLESKLRTLGVELNVLQNPSQFWTELDCTKLALGIWAMSQQEHADYADEDGFDIISSYIVPENYGMAAKALKETFLESLSKQRRDEIKKAEKEAEKLVGKPGNTLDPTPAPAQS